MLQEAGWVGTADTSWRWESSTGGQPWLGHRAKVSRKEQPNSCGTTDLQL